MDENVVSTSQQSGFNYTFVLENGIMEELKMLLPPRCSKQPGAWIHLIRRRIMDTLPPHAQDGNIPLKRCPKCPEGQQWHPAAPDFFSRAKGKKDGLSSHCKTCINKRQREKYHQPEVREKTLAHQKERYHRPEVRERQLARQKVHRSLPEVKQQRKAYNDLYMSRPEVREHKRAYLKDYMERPGARERARVKVRRYQNKPEAQERRKVYVSRPEVRQRMRLSEKVYGQTSKGRLQMRIKTQRRMARKKAIPGSYTTAQIQEQLRRQRYHCYYAYCGFSKFERVKENGQWKYIFEIDHTFPISRVAGKNIPAHDISYLVLACPTCNRTKQDKFPWEWPEGGRLL